MNAESVIGFLLLDGMREKIELLGKFNADRVP